MRMRIESRARQPNDTCKSTDWPAQTRRSKVSRSGSLCSVRVCAVALGCTKSREEGRGVARGWSREPPRPTVARAARTGHAPHPKSASVRCVRRPRSARVLRSPILQNPPLLFQQGKHARLPPALRRARTPSITTNKRSPCRSTTLRRPPLRRPPHPSQPTRPRAHRPARGRARSPRRGRQVEARAAARPTRRRCMMARGMRRHCACMTGWDR